jgi:hypothetical protein
LEEELWDFVTPEVTTLTDLGFFQKFEDINILLTKRVKPRSHHPPYSDGLPWHLA